MLHDAKQYSAKTHVFCKMKFCVMLCDNKDIRFKGAHDLNRSA